MEYHDENPFAEGDPAQDDGSNRPIVTLTAVLSFWTPQKEFFVKMKRVWSQNYEVTFHKSEDQFAITTLTMSKIDAIRVLRGFANRTLFDAKTLVDRLG